jgi:hypothetical protein
MYQYDGEVFENINVWWNGWEREMVAKPLPAHSYRYL